MMTQFVCSVLEAELEATAGRVCVCEWKLHPLPCLFNVSRLMLWGFLSDPRTRFVWCHSFRKLSALWMFEFQFYSSKESVNKIKAIKEPKNSQTKELI